MTTNRAKQLRETWGLEPDPPDCRHLNLELEWNYGEQPTGTYYCTVCGEPQDLANR
jgi:hypothetical protein